MNTADCSGGSVAVITIKTEGPQGPAGSYWLSGAGAPTGAIGKDTDFYIDTLTGNLYGPKVNGLWGNPIYNISPGVGVPAYVHTQTTPSTSWVINHNLGFRPSVELLDSGSQEIDAEVSHPSANQTVVTLKVATAGLARLT